MDLAFTHAGEPGISYGEMWMETFGARGAAGHWLGEGWGIAAIDYDNDGWLDLVAVGAGANGGEVRLLRNLAREKFADVTKEVGLDKVKLSEPRAIVAADLRGMAKRIW